MNEKGMPVIQSAWDYMCENSNNALVNKLVAHYKQYIHDSLVPNLPLSYNDIQK